MADSQQGSSPSRNVDETRDDLAQASLALNTAYDRLQDLRSSLRNFTAQRDRLTSERTRQANRMRRTGTMGPEHSAIVFSDSDDSEIDMDLLRDTLPTRLLELTSRWSSQHARLSAARRSAPAEHGAAPSLAAPRSEEPRPAYPPLRRRRALPQATSSRDNGVTSPNPMSPARRSILEAHLRQLRHVSNPAESTTTLGRRVAQRTAQGSSTVSQPAASGTTPQSDNIVYSTLPLGIEPRPSTSGLESRAASHLRYSLLPNPPSGARTSLGSRAGPTTGGAYPRFGERVEHRPRTARSNSLTASAHVRPSAANPTQLDDHFDALIQASLSARPGQPTNTVAPLANDDLLAGLEGGAELREFLGGTYRVRRRIDARGEEHLFSINWSDLIFEADREDGSSDPAAWVRPPHHLRRSSRARQVRAQSSQDPQTDDTVVQDYTPLFIREGREGSVQRRRGWARLNADGDEISTEDEVATEQARADSRGQRARGPGGSAAILDVSNRSSRDATTATEPQEFGPSEEGGGNACEPANNSLHIINSMFRPMDAAAAYISPLPIPLPEEYVHRVPQKLVKEVKVTLEGHVAGR